MTYPHSSSSSNKAIDAAKFARLKLVTKAPTAKQMDELTTLTCEKQNT